MLLTLGSDRKKEWSGAFGPGAIGWFSGEPTDLLTYSHVLDWILKANRRLTKL